jgi:mRNA interferase RelE/StbE
MLIWKVEWDDRARKELRKLDPSIQKKILSYMRKYICSQSSPKRLGRNLAHDKAGLWRYRIGDYRLICKIEDHTVTILVLAVGHRKEIYK